MSLNKPALHRNKFYHQGLYKPKNPSKVIGNPNNLIYRSGWEKSFYQWCDCNPAVIKYCSEDLVIPYISPLDHSEHQYFVDFVIYVKQKDNSIKKFAVEIKPYVQTQPPKLPRKGTLKEDFQKVIDVYLVNQAKWKAAEKYCSSRGMMFIVLTERQLLKQK